MDGFRRYWILGSVGLIFGCSAVTEAPFPNWLSTAPGAAQEPISGPFRQLAHAGADAERIAGKNLFRVSFSPGQRTVLIQDLAGPVSMATAACRTRMSMPGRDADPFTVLPYQQGWRLISRVLVWKIERAVAMEELDTAIQAEGQALSLGFALTSGSACDAALGYELIDQANAALEPGLSKLDAARLRDLGTRVEAALNLRPSAKEPVEHERRSMLRAVQFIQGAFRDRKLGVLVDQLGKDLEPAIDYLEKLRSKDSKKRAAYFEGFAQEADLMADFYERAFQQNARQRAASSPPELREDRPWRRFSKHFFHSLEPLLELRDASVTRTRLLGLNALLLAECRANGAAPSSLTGIGKNLTVDPYSGASLVYRPEGGHFILYSIGADLKDDGGETNSSGMSPDIRQSGE